MTLPPSLSPNSIRFSRRRHAQSKRSASSASSLIGKATEASEVVTGPNALEAHELGSIRALTATIAQQQNIDETTVCALVASAFNVHNVALLPRNAFDQVVAFLVDLRCDRLIN